MLENEIVPLSKYFKHKPKYPNKLQTTKTSSRASIIKQTLTNNQSS